MKKVVIADGLHGADYIVSLFNHPHFKLIIINPNEEFADYISRVNKVPVYVGDPTKPYTLEMSNAKNADVFIALGFNDCNNYIACTLAKKMFGAKKCICIVTNPKNVDTFKKLGVDVVISSTYLLANTIQFESSVEDIIKTISIEDDRIVLSEMIVKEKHFIANKRISDIDFPKFASISCIYRIPEVIIPHGDIVILPEDKLLMVSSPQDQKALTEYISKLK